WRAAGWAWLAALAAPFGLIRLGLWGVLRRGGGNAGPLGVIPTMRRIAGETAKLPPEVVPALRARWSEPQFFTTMARYIRSLPSCAEEGARQPIPTDPGRGAGDGAVEGGSIPRSTGRSRGVRDTAPRGRRHRTLDPPGSPGA